MKKYFVFGMAGILGVIIFLAMPRSLCIEHDMLKCKWYKSTKITLDKVKGAFDQKMLIMKKKNGVDGQFFVEGFYDAWGRRIMCEVRRNGDSIFYSEGEDGKTVSNFIFQNEDNSAAYCVERTSSC